MFEKDHKIRVTGSTVLKSGPPDLMRIEVEKTRRAGEIGRASGLFRVPEVLDYDEARGLAVFERIRGIEPLCDRRSWGREYRAVAERFGAALAAIHAGLTLPPEMTIPLPAEFADGGREVFLHGDPSVENIFTDAGTGGLVILDWQMTDVHGGLATYGTFYFDVLWFVNNLIWSPTLPHLWRDPVRPVARAFVESYYRAAGAPFDRDGLRRYAERFFTVKLPLRGRFSNRERLYIPRGRRLSRRFVGAVERDYFHD